MERRPGINPGRGRGVDARFRNWERVLGRENASVLWEEVGHSWHLPKLISGNNPIPSPAA